MVTNKQILLISILTIVLNILAMIFLPKEILEIIAKIVFLMPLLLVGGILIIG